MKDGWRVATAAREPGQGPITAWVEAATIAADCLVLAQSRSAYPSSSVLLGRKRRRADAGFDPIRWRSVPGAKLLGPKT